MKFYRLSALLMALMMWMDGTEAKGKARRSRKKPEGDQGGPQKKERGDPQTTLQLLTRLVNLTEVLSTYDSELEGYVVLSPNQSFAMDSMTYWWADEYLPRKNNHHKCRFSMFPTDEEEQEAEKTGQPVWQEAAAHNMSTLDEVGDVETKIRVMKIFLQDFWLNRTEFFEIMYVCPSWQWCCGLYCCGNDSGFLPLHSLVIVVTWLIIVGVFLAYFSLVYRNKLHTLYANVRQNQSLWKKAENDSDSETDEGTSSKPNSYKMVTFDEIKEPVRRPVPSARPRISHPSISVPKKTSVISFGPH